MARTFRKQVQTFADSLLAPFGLSLQRQRDVFSMDGLLARARRRGIAPATVIDIGASDGIWSLMARRHFPGAQFLLFEPLAERQSALADLGRRYGFQSIAAAAGAAPGHVAFTVTDDIYGSGIATADSAHSRTVPVVTIDQSIHDRALPGPFCFKLDTHGFELPILEGAAATLPQTELLIIEAYNFTLRPDSLRFHELCAWLEARQFRCCDLADPMRRPSDGTLWQMDLAFAPANSPIFANNAYR